MIGSSRGLIVLSVIAAALGVAVAVDRPASVEAIDRRLVPGLDRDRVASITIDHVTVAREGGAWRVTAPAPGPADPAAVADLVGALAAARWDRTVPEAAEAQTGLDRPAHAVTIVAGTTRELRFGREVAGAEQVWARVDDGPARLVPAWVEHAIARDAASMRRSQLVRARPGEISGVEIHGRGVDVVVSGTTPRVHLDGGTARVRRELADRLERALVALRAASFPDGGAPATAGVTIRVLGGAAPDELIEHGPCPGRSREAWLDGSAGAVCVADAQLDAIVDAARALAAGEGAIDPAPLQHKRLATIEWPRGGGAVAIAGGGFLLRRLDDDKGVPTPADDDVVRTAVEALTAAAIVEPLPVGVVGTPVLTAIYDDGETDVLEEVATRAGPALRRRGEPFALRVAPAALAAVALGVGDLRDRALIVEEPSALEGLDVTAGARHAHAARGAVVGEWTGDLDGAIVGAAAETIAHLRAAGALDDAAIGAIRLRIDATFAAPPVAGGQPTRHTIEIGAARGDGCAARVDGRATRLDAARCRGLMALAPR